MNASSTREGAGSLLPRLPSFSARLFKALLAISCLPQSRSGVGHYDLHSEWNFGLYWPPASHHTGCMATKRQEDPPRLPSTPETGHNLASSLYRELHRLAAGKMHFERGSHTLQPTALVNEAHLRLCDCSDSMWGDRTRVLGLAANVIRHILVDYARAHNVRKRGDGQVQVTLVEDMIPAATVQPPTC